MRWRVAAKCVQSAPMRTRTPLANQPGETVARADFTADIPGVLKRLHENGQAVVVTENGEETMVVLTPAEFHALRYRNEFVSAVFAGLDDIEEGHVTDDDEFGRELDAEFGPLQ